MLMVGGRETLEAMVVWLGMASRWPHTLFTIGAVAVRVTSSFLLGMGLSFASIQATNADTGSTTARNIRI